MRNWTRKGRKLKSGLPQQLSDRTHSHFFTRKLRWGRTREWGLAVLAAITVFLMFTPPFPFARPSPPNSFPTPTAPNHHSPLSDADRPSPAPPLLSPPLSSPCFNFMCCARLPVVAYLFRHPATSQLNLRSIWVAGRRVRLRRSGWQGRMRSVKSISARFWMEVRLLQS